MFSIATEFQHQNPQWKIGNFTELTTKHLVKLKGKIDGYFSNLGEDELVYFRNSFTANAQVLQAGTGIQENLFELQHVDTGRDEYSEKNLCDFWFLMRNSYKRIAEPAIQVLLLFSST